MTQTATLAPITCEPFPWYGSKPPTQTHYRRGAVPRVHAILDNAIRFLEAWQITDTETDEVCRQTLLSATKAAMRADGMSEIEIAQFEASLVNTLMDHPQWTMTREAPYSLASILKRQGRERILEEQRIVAIPDVTHNALMCEHLLTLFTLSDVLAVPGFVMRSIDLDNGQKAQSLRLDIDTTYARTGFIVPIIKKRRIIGLRVFRYPTDRRPFVLKSRAKEVLVDA